MGDNTVSQLRSLFKKFQSEKSGWVDVFPAVLGKLDGTILTDTENLIFVRHILTGKVYEVFNNGAPTDMPGLHLEVGRMTGEKVLRVKAIDKAYEMPSNQGDVLRGLLNDLFIGRDRFLPFLVLPTDGGGMVVQIYGDVIIKANLTFGWVENQALDLSSYVPVSGALFVLIEADESGVVYVKSGTPVAAKELLTPANIPAITTGRVPSCAVRLYDSQTQLYRDKDSINDFVDVRSLTSGGGVGVSSSYLDYLLDVDINYPTDGQVLTYDQYTEMWVNANSGGGGGNWGSITGTLSSQADLQAALDAKQKTDGWIPYSAVVPTRVASALDGTFTVTSASPAVFTKTAHGFITGSRLYLTTTGSLYTGLTASTDYWVMRIDANTFNLCASFTNAIAAGNGVAGMKINTSGTQSGTHTLHHVEDPVYRLQFAGVDLTAVLQEGMPFKLTQNSIVRHGWVSSLPVYSGGNTTFCGLTRCDDSSANYDILDTGTYPISDFHYGLPKQPGKGFPIFEDYWKISLRDTTNATQASPSTNIYNLENLAVMLPVARWNKSFYVHAASVVNLATTQLRAVNAGLSDNISTYSDIDLKGLSFLTIPASSNATIRTDISRRKIVSVTTETTEYLLCNAAGTTAPTSISFRGDVIDTIIECVCDYL